jgi:segregation and condensation protein A
MIRVVQTALAALPAGKSAALVPLFEQQRSRRAMICLFLAVLEMVKQQAIRLKQAGSFGEIVIKRGRAFDSLVISEESAAKIEEEYKN